MSKPYVRQGFFYPWVNVHERWDKQWTITLTNSKALLFFVLLGFLFLYGGSQFWVIERHFLKPGIKLRDTESGLTAPAQAVEHARNEGFQTESTGTSNAPASDPVLGRHRELELSTNEDEAGPEPFVQPHDANTHELGNMGLSRNPVNDTSSINQRLPTSKIKQVSEPRLTQINAIYFWLKEISSKRRSTEMRNYEYRTLGPVALVNFLIFLIIGPLLSWQLTGFGNPNTKVVSRYTPSCGPYRDEGPDFQRPISAGEQYFLACWNDASHNGALCKNVFGGNDRPQLHVANVQCPFERRYCQESIPARQIEHRLTTSNFGYNSKVDMSLNHRLTCAPLQLDLFISRRGEHQLLRFDNIDHPRLSTGFGRRLLTLNGPNKFSDEFSGGNRFIGSRRYDTDVQLALYPYLRPYSQTETYEFIHPALRRDDGTSFVLLYYHGQTIYQSAEPVTDPIFRATTYRDSINNTDGSRQNFYYPDYEATALGCVEQLQICDQRSGNCTDWGSVIPSWWDGAGSDDPKFPDKPTFSVLPERIAKLLEANPDLFTYLFSIFESITIRYHITRNLKPLLSGYFLAGAGLPVDHPKDQWHFEMQAYFESAFLRARFMLLHFVQSMKPPLKGAAIRKSYGPDFCSKVLFVDSEFTNVNGLGLLIVVIIICVAIVWAWILEPPEVHFVQNSSRRSR